MALGYQGPDFDIMPTDLTNGFRNRIKLRIFKKDDGFKVDGVDPINGRGEFPAMLWIIFDLPKS